MPGILTLAREGGTAWDDFAMACSQLGDGGDRVEIRERYKPRYHPNGEHVHTFSSVVNHPSGLRASAFIHVGVKDDMIFMGYATPQFRDRYAISLSPQVYYGTLWQADNEDGPVFRAWMAVGPIRMAIWYAICARSIEGHRMVGGPYPRLLRPTLT